MSARCDNVFVALLRPVSQVKPSSKTFKSKDYEVFVVESLEPSHHRSSSKDRGKKWKLPHFYAPATQTKAQTVQSVIENVFQVTKATSNTDTGMKVRRVVKAIKQKVQLKGSTHEVTLFVIPTFVRHDPIINLDDHLTRPDGFRCLHETQRDSSDHPNRYEESTRQILEALDRWLKRQQSRPMALQALFRPSALDRIQENITNPAYVSDESKDWRLLANKITPQQAMERMLKLNKCDIVVFNPVFGSSDINPYNKVDLVIMNPFFGQGPPNYDDIRIPDREDWFKGREMSEENRELSWVDEFPLHRAAADGDLPRIQELLKVEPSKASSWDHDGWAPVHYACWYGRTEAFKLLIKEDRCDPNLRNRNQTSLLHLAAGCGHHEIVKLLLDHPYLDRHAVDKEGRTAQECCEQIRSRDWHKCFQLLKDGMNRPYQKLKVHIMDNTEKVLELKHGSATTMRNVLDSMNLPDDVTKCFTLWIASKTLHLQLKPDHRPLNELKKWPVVLERLSGVVPSEVSREIPKIYLRRDAKLMPSVEENVTDSTAIRLLYEEAKFQFLRGMYPCTDEVVIAMAAITLRISEGPHDPKKHKLAFLTDSVLKSLLPTSKLRNRGANWHQKILSEHKELTEQGPTESKDLQLLYLRYCWTQIPAYGCAYFTGYAMATRQQGQDRFQRIVPLYIGVNYRGVFFIKVENRVQLVYVPYHSMTWELCEEEQLFRLNTNNDKIKMIIHTPQAALVCSLMAKLSDGAG